MLPWKAPFYRASFDFTLRQKEDYGPRVDPENALFVRYPPSSTERSMTFLGIEKGSL